MQTDLLGLARTYLPGATIGAVRLPQNLQMVMSRGEGSRVYDTTGKEYIDYLLGSGTLIVGHAHPDVVEAVQHQAARSSTFSTFVLNEPAILLAEKIVNAVPCGEALRYQLSGTEDRIVGISSSPIRTFFLISPADQIVGGSVRSPDSAFRGSSIVFVGISCWPTNQAVAFPCHEILSWAGFMLRTTVCLPGPTATLYHCDFPS